MPAEEIKAERFNKDIDRLIEDTENALACTRKFLAELAGSDTPAHEQIGSFVDEIERKLARLTEKGDLPVEHLLRKDRNVLIIEDPESNGSAL